MHDNYVRTYIYKGIIVLSVKEFDCEGEDKCKESTALIRQQRRRRINNVIAASKDEYPRVGGHYHCVRKTAMCAYTYIHTCIHIRRGVGLIIITGIMLYIGNFQITWHSPNTYLRVCVCVCILYVWIKGTSDSMCMCCMCEDVCESVLVSCTHVNSVYKCICLWESEYCIQCVCCYQTPTAHMWHRNNWNTSATNRVLLHTLHKSKECQLVTGSNGSLMAWLWHIQGGDVIADQISLNCSHQSNDVMKCFLISR